MTRDPEHVPFSGSISETAAPTVRRMSEHWYSG